MRPIICSAFTTPFLRPNIRPLLIAPLTALHLCPSRSLRTNYSPTMSRPLTNSTPSSASPSTAETPTPAPASGDPTVQYIVVRRDLLETWPVGSIIAQAVHASVSAIWESRDDSATHSYCSQEGNNSTNRVSPQMHTVVLETKGEDALLKLADRLSTQEIKYVLWREQPEDYVTALASKPYPRSEVKKHFAKFKLFK